MIVPQIPKIASPLPRNVPVRYLTLEVYDYLGRLTQPLGTDTPTTPDTAGPGGNPLVPQMPDGSPLFGQTYMKTPTEIIHHNDTEVWEVINLTGDVHPIHLHLVNFQVLSRHPLALDSSGNVIYSGGKPTYAGPPIAPDPNEIGWKETVRMYPGQSTRIIMKFKLPKVPFDVPMSPMGGHEYVWHYHILEHEEHDMMRPMIVI